jgi:molybdopterin molybdotransferase
MNIASASRTEDQAQTERLSVVDAPLSPERARELVLAEVVPTEVEPVRLGDALGRASDGRRLWSPELAALAASGLAEVECAQRPTVAVLSCGKELVAPGQLRAEGQVYDSNSFGLAAQVREAGGLPLGVEKLPDLGAAAMETIATALERDVLVIAGDPLARIADVLAELGVGKHFGRVAIRPGGLTWFGVLPGKEGARPTLVFALSGDPVAAMVDFRLFARPALRAAIGLDPFPDRAHATITEGYRKDPGEAHYLACCLEANDAGWRARPTHGEGDPHSTASMVGADALAVIPAEQDEVAVGDRVELELLRER